MYKKANVRPTTFESYEYLIRIQIRPYLGKIKLKDLKTDHIQHMYNEKLKSGRFNGEGGISAKTIRNIHNVIHSALDQALNNNLITRNVSDSVTMPKQINKVMRVFTPNEQTLFIRSLPNERLGAAYYLALSTGIRQGELIASRWQDVDFDKKFLRISHTARRTKTFSGGSGNSSEIIFQEPKTQAGKRIVPLPDNTIRELHEHRKKQLQEKLLAGEVYTNNDLIFCTEVGKPLETSSLIRKFYQLVTDSKIEKANFHALRHTYATRLLEENVHPKVVQEILGHKDITTTLNIYSHVLPEVKTAVASLIDKQLEKIKIPSTREGI